MAKALDLVDTYEDKAGGGLFLNAKSSGGFGRTEANDGKATERAMLVIQQAILDNIYSGTLSYTNDVTGNPPAKGAGELVTACGSFLAGRRWKTANYFRKVTAHTHTKPHNPSHAALVILCAFRLPPSYTALSRMRAVSA